MRHVNGNIKITNRKEKKEWKQAKKWRKKNI